MEIRALRHAGTDWILQICDGFAGWAGGTFFNALTPNGSAGLLSESAASNRRLCE